QERTYRIVALLPELRSAGPGPAPTRRPASPRAGSRPLRDHMARRPSPPGRPQARGATSDETRGPSSLAPAATQTRTRTYADAHRRPLQPGLRRNLPVLLHDP